MEQDDAYQQAASRYQVSYMSDAKWLRLFTAVARSGVVILRAHWSTLKDDWSLVREMPRESDLLPTRFRDGGTFPPFEYKWIFSILVPKERPPYPGAMTRAKQDIVGLRAAIEKAGAFQMEDTDEGLLILAYKR
jgi:hypothetical protein